MKPYALIVLDGFGYRHDKKYNAIAQAHTPHLTKWFKDCPSALLAASGTAVGLPPNVIGNSQAGHLAIGTGQAVPQPITRINKLIEQQQLLSVPSFYNALHKIKQGSNRLHIMGLLSDAGVHCTVEQIIGYITAAHEVGIEHIFIHPVLDGRDAPPQSAFTYIEQLESFCFNYPETTIGSLHGRFYAMDRDKNWNRTQRSYDVLTKPDQTITYPSWQAVLLASYKNHIFDEFIAPTLLEPTAIIGDGDGILFANFRPDRARQLTASFVDPSFVAFPTQHLKFACFITPIQYAPNLHTTVILEPQKYSYTLKDCLANAHKRIFSIAETEKYAHVTYFFNGYKEEPEPNETIVHIPSIKTQSYIRYPRMSAPEITKAVLESLTHDPHDFYLINYANADMVGHSGDFDATVQAVEYLDQEVAKLYAILVKQLDGVMFITADHGKAEDMYDKKTKQPRTAHTNNPVPFIRVSKHCKPEQLTLKSLADIKDYILKEMDVTC